MADKIVQLVDNNDDNIYPVAGSLKDGSVTTNTIEDNAVTASKIDFTTFGKIIYKSTTNHGASNTLLSITSGDSAGFLIAQAVGRATNAGDVTLQLSATNVTDAQGGYGASKATAYGQVSSSLFMAKIPANTTSTITATYSAVGDWREISAFIIPIDAELSS